MSVRNEQCREIAKKLRYTANDDLGGLSLQKNLAAITKAEDGSWRGVMRRLADLIDRRTCRRLECDQHYWRCSRCRVLVYWDAATDLTGVVRTRYCPNCGAEVVDE